MERMAGAEVHLITKEEYSRLGSVALGEQLAEQLRAQVLAIRHGLCDPSMCNRALDVACLVSAAMAGLTIGWHRAILKTTQC